MKLLELHVDRCGVWRNLTLPLRPDGVNVIYGPNEAGKSTLARFIRGVLYGFGPSEAGEATGASAPCAGSLSIAGAGGRYVVQRAAPAGLGGAVSLPGDESDVAPAELLAELLHGIDECLFDSIYAVELRELMELESLSGEEAARQIYGMTLGPEGRRLLEAGNRARAERRRLIDPLQQDGDMVRLFERQDQLQAELRNFDRQRSQHVEFCHRRDQIEQEIADLRVRQAGIREQLQGHRFLQQAWGPWSQLREARQELARLPAIQNFPDDGRERLANVERDLARDNAERDGRLVEARRIARDLRATTGEAPLVQHAPSIRAFVAQEAWLAELAERRDAARNAAADAERQFETLSAALGDGWSEQRLDELDLSPACWQKLAGANQSLLAARARRANLKRRVRRLAASSRELRESIGECLHDLGGQTVEASLAAARDRLKQAHHLARLQLREAELQERQFSLHQQIERLAPQMALPKWVYFVLGVFCFMGIVLAGSGLITGFKTSEIAGTIYALLGITCWGLAWGLKTQFEGDARQRAAEAEHRLAEAASDLREVRGSMRGLLEADAVAEAAFQPRAGKNADPFASAGILEGETSAREAQAGFSAGGPAAAKPALRESVPAGADYVRQAAERVAELVDLARNQRVLRGIRRRLSACRQKLETARREVDTADVAWHDLTSELGLPETAPADEVLEFWQRLVETAAARRRRAALDENLASVENIWNACLAPLAEFGRRVPQAAFDAQRPLATLAGWKDMLGDLARERDRRRELKKLLRTYRADAAELQARIGEATLARHALLMQAGAANSDEFSDRAGQVDRRRQLERECEEAQATLEAICADHSDLALVEEDLLAYDAPQNGWCIETLEHEAADLESDLRDAFERLGGFQREIAALENDRQASAVRFELEQVYQKLCEAARQWAVVETAAQAGDALRADFERRHQPAALIRASQLLEKLTCGRYQRVWSPLGARQLFVCDDRGRDLPAAALSHGTREQLFFAVRMAVVDELAQQGTLLPLILDDVFVNFDERRAAAAVETLLEFAAAGRQILLFTCHAHLTSLFEKRGVEPIRLPPHSTDAEQPGGQRRAG